MQGTFAQYFVVRRDRARAVPHQIDFATAALAEPVSVCLEALERARLSALMRLLVIGDGPFGVIIARLAAALDLRAIVVAGHHDFRLSRIGAAVGINTKKTRDAFSEIMKNAPGGYDAAVLAVGSREAAQMGVECLKARGRLVVFSAIAGQTPVDLFTVHVKELEMVGACNDMDMLDRAVGMLGAPELGLSELVTQRFGLEDFEKAFALAEGGKEDALKVAFTFGDEAKRR